MICSEGESEYLSFKILFLSFGFKSKSVGREIKLLSTSMSKPSYYENMRFKPCLRQKYLMGTSLSVLFAKSIDFILYYNKRIMRDHATYTL